MSCTFYRILIYCANHTQYTVYNIPFRNQLKCLECIWLPLNARPIDIVKCHYTILYAYKLHFVAVEAASSGTRTKNLNLNLNVNLNTIRNGTRKRFALPQLASRTPTRVAQLQFRLGELNSHLCFRRQQHTHTHTLIRICKSDLYMAHTHTHTSCCSFLWLTVSCG